MEQIGLADSMELIQETPQRDSSFPTQEPLESGLPRFQRYLDVPTGLEPRLPTTTGDEMSIWLVWVILAPHGIRRSLLNAIFLW